MDTELANLTLYALGNSKMAYSIISTVTRRLIYCLSKIVGRVQSSISKNTLTGTMQQPKYLFTRDRIQSHRRALMIVYIQCRNGYVIV